MKVQRMEELVAGMTSFRKENYHKDELLSEMFALQKEIVEATFNEDHASTANLRIWDVEKYLEQMNEDCGHVADEELQKFKEESKAFCNLIKAEISGNRGEYKAFKTLEYLHSHNRVLKNVELQDEINRSELDAVVITPKCVTIIEVKNTSRNIFIDEEGNYFRTGEFLKWDCNIAEKMSLKEKLLRKVLSEAEMGHLQIKSILVFTNNHIEVQNKYTQIRTCFINQLVHIIDSFMLEDVLTERDMDIVRSVIDEATSKEAYPVEFDFQQYKMDFASILATFELAKLEQDEIQEKVTITQNIEEVHSSENFVFKKWIKNAFSSKLIQHAGSAAAVVAVTIASSLIVSNTINKGRVQL